MQLDLQVGRIRGCGRRGQGQAGNQQEKERLKKNAELEIRLPSAPRQIITERNGIETHGVMWVGFECKATVKAKIERDADLGKL